MTENERVPLENLSVIHVKCSGRYLLKIREIFHLAAHMFSNLVAENLTMTHP
jgi:hypothetical protein